MEIRGHVEGIKDEFHVLMDQFRVETKEALQYQLNFIQE
jgi:hypothetical protein